MGLLSKRDPMQRAAHFGPILAAGGAAAGGAAAGGSSALPAILGASAAGMGVFGQMMGQGQDAEQSEEQRRYLRELELIRLMESEMMRQQHNRQMGGEIPLRQQLMQNILDPTANQHGRLAANVTPRTFQSGTPGVPSMTPPQTMQTGQTNIIGQPQTQTKFGAPADPSQLSQLVPNFSQFAGASQKAQQMVSGIVPENYQRDSVLPMLNQFGLTRGSYLSGDNGVNEYGEEDLVSRMAQGQRPQDIAPGGRAPFRNTPVSVPTENRRADGYSDQDIRILNEAKRNGASPLELEMLKRQLRGDGR